MMEFDDIEFGEYVMLRHRNSIKVLWKNLPEVIKTNINKIGINQDNFEYMNYFAMDGQSYIEIKINSCTSPISLMKMLYFTMHEHIYVQMLDKNARIIYAKNALKLLLDNGLSFSTFSDKYATKFISDFAKLTRKWKKIKEITDWKEYSDMVKKLDEDYRYLNTTRNRLFKFVTKELLTIMDQGIKHMEDEFNLPYDERMEKLKDEFINRHLNNMEEFCRVAFSETALYLFIETSSLKEMAYERPFGSINEQVKEKYIDLYNNAVKASSNILFDIYSSDDLNPISLATSS